jgi:hypothetical protein
MSFSGNLRTMEAPDLLQWLSERQKTGALEIDNGKVHKRIFFRDGRIVGSASSDPMEYLSHLLLSHRAIGEAELAAILELQEEKGGLLGTLLVGEGKVTSEELLQMLQLKTEEAIFDLFSWVQGEFSFNDDETLPGDSSELSLNVTSLTLQGMRRLDEWERYRKAIPTTTCIPVVVGEIDDRDAPPRERAVLALVDDNRSIHEICLQTRSSEFFVCDVLFRQIQARRLKVVRPPESPSLPSDMLFTTGVTIFDSDTLLQVAKRHLDDGAYEPALRYYRAARSLEPESEKVKALVEQAEARIVEGLREAGIRPQAVPRLARPFEKLAALRLTPEAAFILSRINGSYDLQSIVKITPMPAIDTELLILRLLEAKHIVLE